ncbi:MAG: AzlD domain-containing protein, partial [Erysipelotrichaceae bacterium]|nr:AzlD domain-containing protein [Erysipelotrichaceae bacterium]
MTRTYLYIFLMALTVFLIRVLPLTLIRKQIRSPFLRSFLYYLPYVTLAVMTFPAIIDATASPLPGIAALVLGVYFSFKGWNMFQVTVLCCLSV